MKTILLSSSRAFSLSIPTFLLSTPVENSEATWKKNYKMQKMSYDAFLDVFSKFSENTLSKNPQVVKVKAGKKPQL